MEIGLGKALGLGNKQMTRKTTTNLVIGNKEALVAMYSTARLRCYNQPKKKQGINYTKAITHIRTRNENKRKQRHV